jgi:sugar lactone lactonase YvrE
VAIAPHARTGFLSQNRDLPRQGFRTHFDSNEVWRVYSDHPAWGDSRGGVSVVDHTGKKTLLVRDLEAIQGVAWAPGGKEIWYTAISGDEGRVSAVDLGGKMRVVYSSIASIELFDIAADGFRFSCNPRAGWRVSGL